eukprot:763042-Hanusia_phi.AAC.2
MGAIRLSSTRTSPSRLITFRLEAASPKVRQLGYQQAPRCAGELGPGCVPPRLSCASNGSLRSLRR